MKSDNSAIDTMPQTLTPEPAAVSSEPSAPSPEAIASHPEPSAPSPLRISIVTPSYNQGKFLEKTILSVLEQGYPNLEYIIIDGGSTDESVEIIRKYADRLTYWVSEPDRGQSHAINKGFERATGEIFGWLNSDDWYHAGALQAVVDAFAANPDAGAVVGAGDMFYQESGDTLLVEPFEVTLDSLYSFVDRYFCQPSCFFTAKAWKQCGPLDESLHLAMDLDLWLRLAKEFSFATIPANLSVSLVHADAKTRAQAPKSIVDACLVIGRHGGEGECRAKLIEELTAVRQQCSDLHGQYQHIYDILQRKESELKVLYDKYVALDEMKYHAECRLQVVEAQLAAMQESLSWRLTLPLRWLGTRLNSPKREN